MANRTSPRRRQRRIRVTVAIVILAVAAAVAVPALIIATPVLLSIAVVVAFLCGVAATRIVHTEMTQNRRADAQARAHIAQDNLGHSLLQSRENTAFAESMTAKVAERDSTIVELKGVVRMITVRADVAEQIAAAEAQRADAAEELAAVQTIRADEAVDALAELQRDIETDESELIDELAAWGGTGGVDLAQIDLVQWEEKVIALGENAGAMPRHA